MSTEPVPRPGRAAAFPSPLTGASDGLRPGRLPRSGSGSRVPPCVITARIRWSTWDNARGRGVFDPSRVSSYMRKAISAAGIERPIRPWHDLRHTTLTHDAASGDPAVYVQARAGHAQATMTERDVHAAQVAFPGAAERTQERLFAGIASDDEPTPQKEHACH